MLNNSFTPNALSVSEQEELRSKGFQDCGKENGNPEVIQKYLSVMYDLFCKKLTTLANDVKSRISELQTTISTKRSRISYLEKDVIPVAKDKIANLKGELSDIEINPKKFDLESSFDPVKTGFILFMFIFVTSYLFTFYASAIYMAFLMDISSMLTTNTETALIALNNQVFNPKTFIEANKSGGGALFFVCFFPFVMMLMAASPYFSRSNGFRKYSLLIIALIVDFFLALKITENAYTIKYLMGLVKDKWIWTMIFSDSNFYLVLCAGFAVYYVWGFAVGELHHQSTLFRHLRFAKEKRAAQLLEFEKDLASKLDEVAELNTGILKDEFMIKKLGYEEGAVLINISELNAFLDSYITGWTSYINSKYSDSKTAKPDLDRLNELILKYKSYLNKRLTDTDYISSQFSN
ncbi:MAG: hypothetical protein SFU91_11475 [Chloroherpetonaceae bacterium]|nr:hypothetical protein [Chloroherpetonaceae bacterium]